MKIVYKEKRTRNTFHARKSLEARRRFKKYRRKKRQKTWIAHSILSGNRMTTTKVVAKGARTLLELPAEMNLSSHFETTVSFLEDLRRATPAKRGFGVDFTNLQMISPAASLLLAAELDRWRKTRNARPRVLDIDEWNPEVRRVLDEMGLFQLLNVSNRPKIDTTIRSDEIRFLPFTSGKLAKGEAALFLREQFERFTDQIPNWRYLYEGIQEAMTNVVHHAYPPTIDQRYADGEKNWWLAGSYDPGETRFQAMIFDQGVGIPKTLPRSVGSSRLNKFLEGLGLGDNDSVRIRAAMELGASSTGAPHRGKGLVEIKEFVERSNNGRLRILSGSGDYLYDGSTNTQSLDNHRRSIGGTLIQWSFDI